MGPVLVPWGGGGGGGAVMAGWSGEHLPRCPQAIALLPVPFRPSTVLRCLCSKGPTQDPEPSLPDSKTPAMFCRRQPLPPGLGEPGKAPPPLQLRGWIFGVTSRSTSLSMGSRNVVISST